MELEQLKSEKEAELEALKVEKESELSALLQLQNEMGDADAAAWRNRYQTLLKESAAQRQQLQEELQRQHRQEMDLLRSRQVTSKRVIFIKFGFKKRTQTSLGKWVQQLTLKLWQVPYDGVGKPS